MGVFLQCFARRGSVCVKTFAPSGLQTFALDDVPNVVKFWQNFPLLSSVALPKQSDYRQNSDKTKGSAQFTEIFKIR